MKKYISLFFLFFSAFNCAMKPQRPSLKLDQEAQREFFADVISTLCVASGLKECQSNKTVIYYKELRRQLVESQSTDAFEKFFEAHASRINELYEVTIADPEYQTSLQRAVIEPTNHELWNNWRTQVSKKLINQLAKQRGIKFPVLPKESDNHLFEFLRINYAIGSDAAAWLAPCGYMFYLMRQIQRTNGPAPEKLPFDK